MLRLQAVYHGYDLQVTTMKTDFKVRPSLLDTLLLDIRAMAHVLT